MNRYNKARTTIVKTIDVPIAFAPVEKAQQDRLEDYSAEPESTGQRYYLQVPRLALVFNGFAYAPDRATSVNEYRYFQGQDSQHLNAVFKDIQPSPWNFTYTLFIRTDSISDFSQIAENILPYFNPKLYIRVKEFSFLNIERDLSVVLNDATPDFTDELDKHSMRQINGTITFTVEGWLYKPVDSAKLVKLIRTRYFFEGEAAKDTLMDENGITHTPANATVIVDAPMTVNFTIIQPPRVYERYTGAAYIVADVTNATITTPDVTVLTPISPIVDKTLNDIVWDGSKFIVVGEEGTIGTTIDGTSPIRRSVPAGVELYNLTGVAYNAGVYVAVGKKTLSIVDNIVHSRLVILTSSNGINWEIDSEIDFDIDMFSSDNYEASTLKVFYANSEFIINGATLHVVKGVPGAWSAPIVIPFTSVPITNALQDLMFKDGFYYSFYLFGDCVGGNITTIKSNTSFDFVDNGPQLWPRGFDSGRGVFLFDSTANKWTMAYFNSSLDHFVIDIGDDWPGPRTIVVDVHMGILKKANSGKYFSAFGKTFIVGGDGTTGGIVYCGSGNTWTDITSGEVSLNGIATNGSIILAVGYQAAIVEITPP